MSGRVESLRRYNSRINKILEKAPKYVKEWSENMQAAGKTGSTRYTFLLTIRRYLEYINPNISKINPNELNFSNTQKYFVSIMERNGKPTSDSFQQQVWCSLKCFFDFMEKRKYVKENPMDSIDKPKNHDLDKINNRRVLLNEKDFKAIIAAVEEGLEEYDHYRGRPRSKTIKSRDKAIMLLFMTTGMRKTALIEIDDDDLDFSDYTIKVVDKGTKLQVYPMSAELYHALWDWMEERDETISVKTNALFVTNDGERMSGSAIDRVVARYSKTALGKSISPHKLRSGFVSIYYNKTKDIEAVRRAVGHSNISTTQRYIVTDNKEREDAVEYISSIFDE